MTDLERRVEVLERSRRRWRRVAVTLTLVGCVGLALGAKKDVGELRARKIGVVDRVGRDRIIIGGDDFAIAATIGLLDPQGRERVALSVDDVGGGLYLSAPDMSHRAVLDSGDRIGSHLWFAGRAGGKETTYPLDDDKN